MHKHHRQKLISLFKDKPNEVLFLTGASVSHRYNTDFEYSFRQESNFLYLTGIQEPDFALLIEPGCGEWHLFAPRRDAMFAVWMGFVRTQKELKEAYEPDHIHYLDELDDVLKGIAPDTVHVVFDNDAAHVQRCGLKHDKGTLADALAWCRVIKTEDEMVELRKAGNVANLAHREVMRAVKPGMYEYEVMALYEYVCTKNGLRHQPYSGIHASGRGSAVLHYVDNNRLIKDGSLMLIDAGAESNGYAADITRTFPANGKFSDRQAAIYDVCLRMQTETISRVRDGIEMEELHLLSARVMLEGLKELGLVYGEIDELMDKNIFALFFPHGLGHFLGLDTHDVGGYPKGKKKIDRPGLRYLRARRLLEPGMVITIEPGIYFIPPLLEPAFEDPKQSEYLNIKELKTYLDFGGIRIEDDLIIKKGGHDNLTDVPKTREEIEKWMAG